MSKEDPKTREPNQGDMKYDPATNGTQIYISDKWIPIANSITAEENEKISKGMLRGMSIETTTNTSSGSGSVSFPTTGPVWTTPTTSPGIMVMPQEVAPVPQKKTPKKVVEFPKKVTKKVVIGFVEDDDTIVWGAKLNIVDFHIDFETIDGEGRITLVTDIEDVGA